MKLPVCCLAALLVACDGPEKTADSGPAIRERAKPSRPTKSDRPAKDAQTDPTSAKSAAAVRTKLESAEALADPDARKAAIAALVWEAGEVDLEMAREAFSKLPAGSEERGSLLDYMAMRAAGEDPAAAVAWAKALPDAAEQSAAVASIAQVIAGKDPRAAAEILAQSGVAGRDLDVATVQVVRTWAGISPQDAADWVTSFQTGEARESGMQAVISTWADQDPAAANAWIGSLQNRELHQEAANGMAETIVARPEFLRQDLWNAATPEIQEKVRELEAAAAAEIAPAAEE